MDKGGENHRGVLGGEGVGRKGKDEASPEESGPPSAKPGGDEESVQAGLHFGQLRCGAGVAPGLRVGQV